MIPSIQKRIYVYKKQFVTDAIFTCATCGHELHDFAIYAAKYHKTRKPEVATYCQTCAEKVRQTALLEKYMIVVVLHKVPAGAIPVLEVFPGLVQRADQTVWTACDSADGAEIIDRTKYAGRESWAGASIGASVREPKAITDAGSHLRLLQRAEIIGDKKLLEAKR